MITQKNYEIYFADYLDGTLGEAETAELKAFLLVHPELSKLIEDNFRNPLLLTYIKNL